jgi:hypothetical protein
MGGKMKYVSDYQAELATSVKTEGLEVSQVVLLLMVFYSEYKT